VQAATDIETIFYTDPVQDNAVVWAKILKSTLYPALLLTA